MLSRVIAKNVGDVFWDTVYIIAGSKVKRQHFHISGEIFQLNCTKFGDNIIYGQSSELPTRVLYFRYIAPFWNEGDSKVTGSKIETKFRTVSPPTL